MADAATADAATAGRCRRHPAPTTAFAAVGLLAALGVGLFPTVAFTEHLPIPWMRQGGG